MYNMSMKQKWNLQDIKPPQTKKRRRASLHESSEHDNSLEGDSEVQKIKLTDGRKKSRMGYVWATLIFILVLGGGIFISYISSGAEVVVHPRNNNSTVNAEFTAFIKGESATDLHYEIMSLDASGEKQVRATGQEEVTEQARGQILIYNRHTTEPIRLVTNTRFESENGLVFRISDPAIVPGYVRGEDGEIVPGVTQADVFADQPGNEYNLAPTTFTIPGFSGSPEFNNVTAESVDSMKGGFDGIQVVVEESELQTAQQALRTELRNSLIERLENEKPAGYVMLTGAQVFVYESLPTVEMGSDLATIKEKTTLQIPIFNKEDFASFLAYQLVPGYQGEPVRLNEATTDLTFEYASSTVAISDLKPLNSIDFKLVGRAHLVWTFDESDFLSDLQGSPETALQSIREKYKAIERVSAVIRPFWRSAFPTDIDRIKIIESLD